MIVGFRSLTDIAIRTSVVYLALLVGLRLTGQRQLGQMSSFDLVLLLIISNAVQNAMVGPDTSLLGGLVAAAILIVWHQVIDRVRRASRRASRLIAREGDRVINSRFWVRQHPQPARATHD